MSQEIEYYVQTKATPIVDRLVVATALARPELPVPFMIKWLAENSPSAKAMLNSIVDRDADDLQREVLALQADILTLETLLQDRGASRPTGTASSSAGHELPPKPTSASSQSGKHQPSPKPSTTTQEHQRRDQHLAPASSSPASHSPISPTSQTSSLAQTSPTSPVEGADPSEPKSRHRSGPPSGQVSPSQAQDEKFKAPSMKPSAPAPASAPTSSKVRGVTTGSSASGTAAAEEAAPTAEASAAPTEATAALPPTKEKTASSSAVGPGSTSPKPAPTSYNASSTTSPTSTNPTAFKPAQYQDPDDELVDSRADAKAAASRSANSLPEVSYDEHSKSLDEEGGDDYDDDDDYDDTFEDDESPPLPE